MIRAKIHSYVGSTGRVWFYDVFDTERPKGNMNLVGGVRLTHRGAIDAACIWLKYRKKRDNLEE